jgi:hypothetical protein
MREVRRKSKRDIYSDADVEDSSGGTRGQLVGGTVEGQVVGFYDIRRELTRYGCGAASAERSWLRLHSSLHTWAVWS